MISRRIEKINALVKKNLDEIISRELDFGSSILVSVTKVDTSRDLRYTHVFVSIYPEDKADYAMNILKNKIYQIQGCLNKKLSLKPLPRINFSLDLTESKAEKVEKLLKDPRI